MNELLKLFIIMGQQGVASGFDMFENDKKKSPGRPQNNKKTTCNRA
jgi:hypothetical protein